MSSFAFCCQHVVRPSLSQSINHGLTTTYTRQELHLSSGPRQPLDMVFACFGCATNQDAATLLESLHAWSIAVRLLAVPVTILVEIRDISFLHVCMC